MGRIMTDEEIATMYRDSKYKGNEVAILAQLNACPKSEIIEVLEHKGFTFPEHMKIKSKRKVLDEARETKAEEDQKDENGLIKNDESKKESKKPGRKRKIKTDLPNDADQKEEQAAGPEENEIPISVWATVKEKVTQLHEEEQRLYIRLEEIDREIREHEEFISSYS